MNISQFNAGDRIVGQFLLADAKKGVKESGAVYWSMVLQDNSGTMEAKKWDYSPEDEKTIVKGNVIQLDGDVLRYRNALQMKVHSVELIDQDKVDWSRFLSCAPMSVELMKEKLDLCLSKIADPDIAALTKALVNDFLDDFLIYPAAVRNHHDYLGGLLFHSLLPSWVHSSAPTALYCTVRALPETLTITSSLATAVNGMLTSPDVPPAEMQPLV
jgi:3'-5' exoribonuclease